MSTSSAYLFDNRLIVRTPRFAFSERVGAVQLDAWLQDQAFLEAIYLASPVLYDECMKYQQGQLTNAKEVEKLTRSLSKYFRRMSSRCTPFGLFSGCAATTWTTEPSALRLDTRQLRRHTRLDMLYLCALAQKLAALPSVRRHLLYFPNTSIYSIGDELRYVEYTYGRRGRRHQISSVMASEYLRDILQAATAGITTGQMVARLVSDDITQEEAGEFIEAVVSSQLLVDELEPAITGPEFLYQIIDVLTRLNQDSDPEIGHIISTLRTVDAQLLALDTNPQNQAADYRQLMTRLDALGVAYEPGKLFQTDLSKVVEGPGLNLAFQDQLHKALEVLNKMTMRKDSERFQSFVRRFAARYEDKEMPLLEVMDTETGLGYLETTGSSISPLVGNLQLSRKEQDKKMGWGKLEIFLNDKLQKAYEQKALNVDISDAELANFTANWDDLAPSLSVMFRLVDSAAGTLYVESVGGSSAANLLGRFAHSDPAINELVCQITQTEQAQSPDVVYAEIIHLPESRVGNVLLHPVFRAYEIPYLAKSSLPKEFQLDVQDLCISVQAGRVVLRSKRLNKEVVPRLSNAHNYSQNALPVYQFLCDLQFQGKQQALHFNWGNLQLQHQFLPRVTCHNTIIHLARWTFFEKDIKPLLGLSGEALLARIAQFRHDWNLPQHAVLADGDHELLVDFNNESMVQIWLESVKGRPNSMMREFIHSQSVVVDEHNDPYVNQFVAVLLKHAPSYKARVPAVRPAALPQAATASFAPGSEWIYFKLYCGLKSADKMLLNAVKPLSEELLALGLIDKWFFIRYNDPEFHLRLRFHLTDIAKIGDALRIIHSYLQPFQTAGYLWKQQLDTYQRELDRYGSNAIELAETFFYHDSVALLGLLDLTEGDERENVKWLWGLRAVDELLDGFRYSLPEKAALLLQLRTGFANEFNMDKPLKLQMDFKYRSSKPQIDQIMNRDQDLQSELYPLLQVLRRKAEHLEPMAAAVLALHERQELPLSVPNLLSSYIHMLLNRITTSNPRLHELVLYDFLSRYYQSALARAKPRAVAAATVAAGV